MIAMLVDDLGKRVVADAETGDSQQRATSRRGLRGLDIGRRVRLWQRQDHMSAKSQGVTRRTGAVLLAAATALVVAVTARAEYDPPITTLVTNMLQSSGSDRIVTLCESQDGLYQGFRTGPKQGGYVKGRPSPYRAYKTEIISTPVDGHTYRYDENIDIALTFNTDVYVPEDDSWIVIQVGDAADGPNTRVAEYLSGSDTNRLVYRYQVEFDDADANGISVDEGGSDTGFVGWVPAIVASSGSLPVERYFPGVADDPIHKVDGSLQSAVGMGPPRGDGGLVRTTVADDARPDDRKRVYP